MTELLRLMEEGTAWNVETLASRLGTTTTDIRRRIEYLEQMGYLRRINGCSHDCQGCSAHCSAASGLSGMPVFWELIPGKRQTPKQ